MSFRRRVLIESNKDKPKLFICTPRISVGGMERAFINLLNMSNISKNYEVWAYIGYIKDKEYMSKLPQDVHVHVVCKGQWNIINKIKTVFKMLWDCLFIPKFNKSICFGHNNAFLSLITRRASKDNIIFIHADLDSRNDKQLKNIKRFLKFEKFKKIACVSNKAAESYKKYFSNQNVFVINNYINGNQILEESKENTEDITKLFNIDKLAFVNICRQEEKSKKLSRLINAVYNLKQEKYDFKIYLIGNGPDTNMYKEMVNNLNLQDYIIFLGQKINPYPYIKNSSALVFCSIYEGYGIVLDEARVLNVPFISTDVADARLIAKEGFGIVCDNSEEGIYKAIKEFIINGYKITMPFDYNKFNDNITQKLDKLLED